jgi:hypothetical protein
MHDHQDLTAEEGGPKRSGKKQLTPKISPRKKVNQIWSRKIQTLFTRVLGEIPKLPQIGCRHWLMPSLRLVVCKQRPGATGIK